jgi:hypothetical protein
MKKALLFLWIIFSLLSCKDDKKEKKHHSTTPKNEKNVFTKIASDKSHITFKNDIKETYDFNFLNYSYTNIGCGVSASDINNDGLVDLYFTSTQNENKLYINKGNFVFEDISKKAGIEDATGITTGVSAIDINNDGWMDYYVCKSGSVKNGELRKNKLFVNQKDNTFKEEAAKWNIDDKGFSTQSYFFDMDKDGDVDMYLVNHRADFKNNTKIDGKIQGKIIKEYSDQLYRNDGDTFVNVTKEAGIYNKAWGLSAVIGDFNNDNWADVYVANDFLEPDILYINNKNGTFTNTILKQMRHITFSSMGSDYADFNNDLLPDLMVLEMTPSDHKKSKENMASMNTANFNSMVRVGYHHQYMANVLQLNNGNNTYSEIGQIAHVAKTDWSWTPLLADFDNDGLKDLFISNGIEKDMGNQDFRIKLKKKNARGESMSIEQVLEMIPQNKVSNYMFQNQGDLTFKNKAKKWNLDTPSFSNGSVYADLDNDGDLDLVVNNMKDIAFVYQNNSDNNYLQLKFKGPKNNPLALGTKAYVFAKNLQQVQELYLSRGYMSSVQPLLNFGFNKLNKIDSVKIVWPDSKTISLKDVDVNQVITFDYKDAQDKAFIIEKPESLMAKADNSSIGLTFKHKDNDFNDFRKQILLPHAQSHNGPFLAKADVNADGFDDIYVGGAVGQSGALYTQNKDGVFSKKSISAFEKDKKQEDLGVLFFDADNDNDVDLYVVSGDTFYPEGSDMYQDRLYLNDGKGNFTRAKNALPMINASGQTVIADDIDKDGDIDLFVGGRVIPDKYPYAPKSYFLINEKGVFKDKIKEIAPELEASQMVSNALFTDYDNDGDKDLLVVGEWSKIQFYNNKDGKFSKIDSKGLEDSVGLWFGLAQNDIDNDGDMDYFIGNISGNAKFSANSKKEFHVYCDDFDYNGTYDIVLSKTYKGDLVPARGKECSTQQMSFVSKKFPTYHEFAEAKLTDIYGENKLEKALHYQANILHNVFLENLGNGQFKMHKLPNEAQFSPIHSFNFIDIDKDGKKEIIAIGNTFEAEVETQRYDASYGIVLKFKDGKFESLPSYKSGLSTTGNAKNSLYLTTNDGSRYLLVTNNDAELDIFKLKK